MIYARAMLAPFSPCCSRFWAGMVAGFAASASRDIGRGNKQAAITKKEMKI